MKTINLFIAIALFFTINSFGQLDRKTWLVGGSGSFNSYKQDQSFISQGTGESINTKYNYTNIQISSSVGYFIIDKLATGLKVTYSDLYGNSEENGEVGGRGYNFGPFARYYFLNKEKQFNILTEINYQYGFIDASKINSDNNDGTTNSISLLVGTEIFFNSSIGIEFLLGYKEYNQKMKNINTPSINQNGIQFLIGFQIHLEKK